MMKKRGCEKKTKAKQKLTAHAQENPLPDRARPTLVPVGSKHLFVREIFPQIPRIHEESVQQPPDILRSASHERVALFT